MMTPARIISAIVALVLVWMVGASIVERAYAGPRRALIEKRDQYASDVERGERQELARIALDRELETIANRTLGSNSEAANSELRATLNRIGAELSMAQLRTNARTTSRVASPAKSQFKRNRDLRDRADFQAIEGTITGRGSLEQALRLVHRIDAEPWIKHIDTVGLDPKENGEQFDITVKLTTLYIPGAKPERIAFTYDPAGFEAYRSIIERNPFRKPAPPPPEVPPVADPVEEEKPPPPPFPYQQWELRGVVRDGANSQVLLGNDTTQETRWLTVGESLHKAVLVSVGLDEAEFTEGDQAFVVSIGRTLKDRRPVKH